MKAAVKVAWMFVALGIAAALLSLLIPVPQSWTESDARFYWPVASSLVYAVLHIGAAVLFLMALNVYKTKLRTAYHIIASAIVIIALGLVQVPILAAFDQIESMWVQGGGVMLPLMAAGILSYIGVRSMAHQVGIVSPLTKYWLVLLIVIGGLLVASVLPHTAILIPEMYFDVTVMIIALDLILYAICMLIMLRVRKLIGEHYTSAMAWLAVGFMASVTTSSVTVVSLLILGPAMGNYGQDAASIIGGLIYLKAGLTFALTKEF